MPSGPLFFNYQKKDSNNSNIINKNNIINNNKLLDENIIPFDIIIKQNIKNKDDSNNNNPLKYDIKDIIQKDENNNFNSLPKDLSFGYPFINNISDMEFNKQKQTSSMNPYNFDLYKNSNSFK